MLVTMKEILNHASKGNYGVAAPNVCMELDSRAVIEAAEELKAPVILDVAYFWTPDIHFLGKYLCELAEQATVPVAINLDHGKKIEEIIDAIKAGFTSVMMDSSSLPYEQNIQKVCEVVNIAHAVGVTVEAELGHVGTGENYDIDGHASLTSADQAVDFVKKTGIDCLAIAIGTAHGYYKAKPHIDFERLAEIKSAVGDLPLVLHGSSGTGDDVLEKLCKMGINKVNVSNDLMKAACKEVSRLDWSGNGCYELWPTAMRGFKKRTKEVIEIYGGKNRAWQVQKKEFKGNLKCMHE